MYWDSLTFESFLINSTNLSIIEQISDQNVILSCSRDFLGCLWPGLFPAKNANVKKTCIRSVCTKNTYVGGVVAIKYLRIHL